jgi:hypothetical protein
MTNIQLYSRGVAHDFLLESQLFGKVTRYSSDSLGKYLLQNCRCRDKWTCCPRSSVRYVLNKIPRTKLGWYYESFQYFRASVPHYSRHSSHFSSMLYHFCSWQSVIKTLNDKSEIHILETPFSHSFIHPPKTYAGPVLLNSVTYISTVIFRTHEVVSWGFSTVWLKRLNTLERYKQKRQCT